MPTNGTLNFNKVRTIFFFSLILLFGIGFLYLIKPFLYPIFWAAVIAIMFRPIYLWLNKHLRMPGASSVITMLIVLAVLVLPLTVVALLLINESIDLYNSVTAGDLFQNVRGITAWLKDTPLSPYLSQIQEQWAGYAANATKAISIFLFENLKNLTQNSIRFIFMSFLMLYTLYYFLKDGDRMLKRVMHLSPLGEKYEEMLYHRFTSTTRATLKGTIIVGGIQGLLGGLLFWLTGIEGALIWGVVMMVFSILPGVGAFLIWAPAGLIMILFGNIWQGIVILAVGVAVISTVDNLLRPSLVGKDIQMHPLFVLFSTLGGIFLFGVSGFVIGPIVAALFLSVLSIYDYYYRDQLENT